MAETWDETKPAGSRNPALGDDDIREFKRALRERLAEDHEFTSTESPAFGASNYKIGKHRYVTLLESSGDKTTLENEICILAKNLSGHPEIYIVPESGGSGVLLTRNNASKIATDIGFHNGEIGIAWPTNNLDSTSTAPKVMVGNSNTIVWFYNNTAPPGWKALTTGYGTILAVSDVTGTSTGTATSTTADHLVDSGATFQTDGVEVGDTVYNVTDQTVATVTVVNSETDLTIDADIFASGEVYIVGRAFVEAGGRQASDGSWTISDLSASYEDGHTHGPGSYAAAASTNYRTDVQLTSDGTLNTFNHTHSITGNSAAGSGHSHDILQGGQWRPTASIGKLFQLDTA